MTAARSALPGHHRLTAAHPPQGTGRPRPADWRNPGAPAQRA